MDYDVVIVARTRSGPRWRPGSVRPATESACFERHGTLFGLPRAIRFDGEAMSLFQNLGIGEEIEHDIVPAANYVWYGTDEPPRRLEADGVNSIVRIQLASNSSTSASRSAGWLSMSPPFALPPGV